MRFPPRPLRAGLHPRVSGLGVPRSRRRRAFVTCYWEIQKPHLQAPVLQPSCTSPRVGDFLSQDRTLGPPRHRLCGQGAWGGLAVRGQARSQPFLWGALNARTQSRGSLSRVHFFMERTGHLFRPAAHRPCRSFWSRRTVGGEAAPVSPPAPAGEHRRGVRELPPGFLPVAGRPAFFVRY